VNFYSLGISYKTAPIDVREKFYLTPIERELFLSEVKNDPRVAEAFILSTCNRTEIYANTIDQDLPLSYWLNRLGKIKKISATDFESRFYACRDEDVVRHLFELSTGLDSLVVGEKQILGQLKDAVEMARGKGMFSNVFNILVNYALRTGKKAQTETQICYGGSSVSWAAVAKAQEVLGDLKGLAALVIGAGEMGKLSVGQIAGKGFGKMFLMNRTHCMAQGLAQKHGGEAVPFSDIKEILSQVDLCICASGAPHYIIEKTTVETCMAARPGRKIVFVDISMPRNIDPKVSEVSGIELYGIDDLQAVVGRTMNIRQKAMEDVRRIISRKIEEFYQKLDKREEIFS